MQDTFTAFMAGQIIDTIDLSANVYSNEFSIKSYQKLEPNKYKVINLIENKIVYFTYRIPDRHEEHIYLNPFEICDDTENKCHQNVTPGCRPSRRARTGCRPALALPCQASGLECRRARPHIQCTERRHFCCGRQPAGRHGFQRTDARDSGQPPSPEGEGL